VCSKDERHARTCVHCHREWQAKCPTARYCSTRCQYLASGSRVILACQACGQDFECRAMEMRAGRRFCSRQCMLGVRRRPSKHCPECGKTFCPRRLKNTKKGKGIYCSKQCAGAARRAGKREGRWKEAQELRACRAKVKPSQKMYAAIQLAMRQHLEGIADLYRRLNNWRPCLNCGGPLKGHANERTMFCSISCSAEYCREVCCRACGAKFVKRGVQGKAWYCVACKQKRIQKYKRRHGKGIAKRAKRYGVERVPYDRVELLARDGWQCQLCLCPLRRKWTYNPRTFVPHPKNATLDHIIPMSKGGADAPWNIQACCLECNGKKSASTTGQLRLNV